MKHVFPVPCRFVRIAWIAAMTSIVAAQSPKKSSNALAESPEPIAVSDLCAKAEAQYHGDGLSVTPTPEGARLRCVFQKLAGQVTREGLWLVSTAGPQTDEKFRVAALAVGRPDVLATLPPLGSVTVADKLARCSRPGLIEE